MADDTRAFGKYLIEEQVGRGGFATVYRARDTTLDREIALKILHPHYTIEPDFAERFLHEARTVASLNHPHIITLYEVGDLDGQLFIAMELVRGGSLYQRLESDGPVEVEETIDLLAGVADALDYAHSKGLIHRDIKPANILLRSTHRNQLEGVLTDFGLVKVLSRSTQLTRSGTILGTLEYMAPEQIDSDLADQIGPASDIYALGIVAYQMLTGQAPFTGSTAQVMNGHLNKTPPSPAEIRSEVPVGVSDAILKAIAKNPADRYATAVEFVNALKDAETAVAAPVPVPEPKAPAPTAPVPEPVPPPVSTPAAVAAPERNASAPPVEPPPSPPGQPEPERRSRLPLIIAAGAIIGLILIFVILRGTVFKQDDTIPIKKEDVVNPVEPGVVAEGETDEVMAAEPTAPLTETESTYTPTPDDQALAIAAIATAEAVRENLDGQLVFTRNTEGGVEGAYEIYTYDLGTWETTRLTDNHVDDWIPRWTPDGKAITFTSNRSGQYDIWMMNADGSNPQSLINSDGWDEYASWAPAELSDWQGSVAFVTTAETGGVHNAELYIASPGGAIRLTENQVRDEWPTWWADNAALVYSTERDGDMDIVSMPLFGDMANYIYEPALIYGTGADENQPAASPTADEIVFVERIYTDDAYGRLVLLTPDSEDGYQATPLTDADAASPSWSPDGKWIVYSRCIDSNDDGLLTKEDDAELWAVRPSDGLLIPLVQESGHDDHPSWGFADYEASTPTPEGDYARIDYISIADGLYVVDFETVGFKPKLPGQHVHFFFDTVAPKDAGLPGSGPWQIYPTQNGEYGTSPFSLYKVSQRPNKATQMCVLVANSDHSVQQNTGNCLDLP